LCAVEKMITGNAELKGSALTASQVLRDIVPRDRFKKGVQIWLFTQVITSFLFLIQLLERQAKLRSATGAVFLW